MFSEYASRFLQQSTAGRLSFTQNESDSRNTSRNPLDRRRQQVAGNSSRYVQRQSALMPTPYGNNSQTPASQSRFPFANRLRPQQEREAPLFFSATDEFGDGQDQEEEHEREVADFYALQRSRRNFGRSHMTESSELEDDSMERTRSQDDIEGQRHDRDTSRGRARATRMAQTREDSMPESESSAPSSGKGKGRLVDVNLASTIAEEDPPESLAALDIMERPDDPPAPFQTIRQPTRPMQHQSSFLPVETDMEAQLANPRPPSPSDSIPPAPTVILPSPEPPRHDALWANLFQLSTFAMFAAFILVWFHTSAPDSKKPLGDTIYSALRGSTNMLLWDTLIAIIVALAWLALLRHHVRPLIYLMIAAVPIIMFSFSIYSFVSSFRGSSSVSTVQDKVMRWLSWVPLIFATVFTMSVLRSRHSLDQAISILEFSTRILATSKYLIVLGFVTLATTVIFTWIWMLMFERVFLGGRFVDSGAKRFLLYANSWWLGAFFILQYLWTLGIIAGIQRATTAATVSQWYFHRLSVPQPSSQQVVKASFMHATGALSGTVCLSTFLSLLVRLPLILLPGRLANAVTMCAYWIIPSSIVTLTNPLTLTYAAIHSQPLGISARGLGQLNFVSRTNPSNTLGPAHYNSRRGAAASNGMVPYRLAKLLLQATRWIMSLALGFGGWVRTARSLEISGSNGLRGSLYAYIVGFIAATIGFAVLGAIENVVGAVLDAAVICWASETGGHGEARFCREAGELFGNDE